MRTVVIVGTSHSIQAPTKGTNAVVTEEFKRFLRDLCAAFGIRAVAEEISAEALGQRSLVESIPMQVASSLNLDHRCCDPESAERIRLGILQENDIRAQGFLQNWSEIRIAQHVAASHTKREGIWLKHLQDLNRWPVLFVCGANHVQGFHSLLREQRLSAVVATEDWASNNTPNPDARGSCTHD